MADFRDNLSSYKNSNWGGSVGCILGSFSKNNGISSFMALLCANIMIAQQVAGKATRDALFLSIFNVTELPKMMMVSTVLSMAGVLLMSRLIGRFGPARLMPVAFALSAVAFFYEWWLFERYPDATVVILYLHISVVGAILISGFWSVVNEHFELKAASKNVVRIAAAAALGGLLGGIIAERVTLWMDVRSMVLVLAAMHILCAFLVGGVGAKRVASIPLARPEIPSGLTALGRSSYLRYMAMLMLLAAAMAALLDYAVKVEVSKVFEERDELVRFFAAFYALTSVLTFILQSTLGERLLQRLGIGGSISMLPAVVFLGGLVGSVLSHIWMVVVLRGTQVVLANSLFKAGFELLYVPLPVEEKRPTKTLIDVGADRVGDFLGCALIMLLMLITPNVSNSVLLFLAGVLAIFSLYVARHLQRGYDVQVEENQGSATISCNL